MATRGTTPGPRYEALLGLLRASEAIWNASRIFFSRWDLSPSQFNVLNLLRGHPKGLSQIDLSRRLIMHRSNATGLIDRLEDRNLVRRLEEAADRRAYRVVLTESGRRLILQILPEYYAAAERVWEDFPVHQAKRLSADLERLGASAERMARHSGARETVSSRTERTSKRHAPDVRRPIHS